MFYHFSLFKGLRFVKKNISGVSFHVKQLMKRKIREMFQITVQQSRQLPALAKIFSIPSTQILGERPLS